MSSQLLLGLLSGHCRLLPGFSSDCEIAIGQATGRCSCEGSDGLAAVSRQVMQALAAGRPALQGEVRHVRSHQGQPANELADFCQLQP